MGQNPDDRKADQCRAKPAEGEAVLQQSRPEHGNPHAARRAVQCIVQRERGKYRRLNAAEHGPRRQEQLHQRADKDSSQHERPVHCSPPKEIADF